MSKDSSKKNPIPENRLQRFISMVYMMADLCGIEEDTDIYHYVELLVDAVSRKIFEETKKVPSKNRTHSERKRFIAIFKAKHLELLDLEYMRPVTNVEAKQIEQTNRELSKHGFSCEDYLMWLFDVFIPDNPKFRVIQIKTVCSHHFLYNFIDGNRHLAEDKKQVQTDKKISNDLFNRARVVARSELSSEEKKKALDAVKAYGDGSIMLSEFRTTIEELEKKIN